ncbi:MAG TPA: carbohydrate-binding protein, partial [Planctomycetota bacterium]|nr:carbohydrate-binding protein [Planctomycetota bacterium]
TAAENGANLIVAHHPHTIYGIATLEGSDPPVICFLSLGNLVFDQDVFETFQSVVAVVDVEKDENGDVQVRRAEMFPFHIEGYVPKAVSGAWAARIGRHLGHLSTYLPAAAVENEAPDGWKGLVVFPAAHRVAICRYGHEYTTAESLETRAVSLEGDRSLPESYDRIHRADSLARVRTSAPASVELGRDLFHYGDFEDFDVDDAFYEGPLWNQSVLRFVQNSNVRNGQGAFVLLRDGGDREFIQTWLKNRVTFPPNARLTLTGWWKGRNAGRAEIVVRWYVRDEREVISTFIVGEHEGGTFDWERFDIDVVPPASAGTVRFYFRQYPPDAGDAALFLDDVSLVLWEDVLGGADAGVDVPTPNNWSFLRIHADSEADAIGVTLTHRVYELAP